MVYTSGTFHRHLSDTPGFKRSRSVSLNVLQWNAGGLSQTKRADLIQTLQKENIDVFAIMEANLKMNGLKYYPFPGYSLYLLPKYRQVASGILVGVRKDLIANFKICKEMGETTDKSEITKLNVWKAGIHFTIYALYIPPATKPDLSILSILQKTIVIGDMNAHSLRWGYQDVNAAGSAFEDLLNSSALDLIYNPDDPHTYIHYNGNGSTPDLLCVSPDIGPFTKRKVIKDPGSGHREVIASINLNHKQQMIPQPMKSWNFKKADWIKFENLTKVELHEDRFNFDDQPSKLITKINKAILRCAKLSIPRGKVKLFRCFWTNELEETKGKRDRLRRKAELTKNSKDVTAWRKQVAVYKKMLLEAKRKAFENFISHINYREDSLKTYRFLENIQNKRSHIKKEPIIKNDKILTSDRDIANAFGQTYAESQRKGVYARKMSGHIKKVVRDEMSCSNNSNNHDVFNAPFSEVELNHAINYLKMKKSPGEDNLHAEFLRHLSEVAKRSILLAFNRIWETGSVPSHWKRAVIIPILKKGKDSSQTSSYRPISLTSILGKLMERLIVNRMNWYLEENRLLAPEQAGFRKNRSTNDQVTLFSQMVKDALDERNILTAVFIDFKGAYDKVWREMLYKKLLDVGINGRMLKWIRAFTDQRICKVKYGNNFSRYYNLQTGLPQGSVSSCILFNIYINNIVDTLKSITGVHCLLFADDLVIWTQAPKRNAKLIIEKKLNRAMTVLSNWCTENNMIVNLDKTAIQSFSLTHEALCPEVRFEDTVIASVDNYKYLGVTFDRKLSWRIHIESLLERSHQRLNILKRLAGSLWGCARTTLNITYKTFVLPLILYCCEPLITASDQLFNKLETFHNQALRLITGAVKTTPINAMLLLTKNLPIRACVEEKAVILYEKLLRIGDPFWTNYQDKSRNLKTQYGFLQKVRTTREDYDLIDRIQEIEPPLNPLSVIYIETHLNLVDEVTKGDTSTEVLKCLALETINTKYPIPNWTHVYTDGSYCEDLKSAGSGVYSSLFSFYAPAGKNRNAFDGEVEALRIALKQLLTLHFKFENAVLLSDSRAAIQAIGSLLTPISAEVLQCRDYIRCLQQKSKKIVIQWIPGHSNIFGNEQADFLARKGATLEQPTYTNMSYHSIKLNLKHTVRQGYQLKLLGEIQSKLWNIDDLNCLPDLPRRDAVASFRLLTGHDCLGEHLYSIGIFAQPFCPLCDLKENMNRAHLRRCKALLGCDSEFSRYWRARDCLRQ